MNNSNEIKNIRSYVVKAQAKSRVIYAKMGNQCVNYESYVYHFMGKLSAAYTGGLFDFILVGDAFYMRLRCDEKHNVINVMNGNDHIMSADALSLCASIFALSLLAEKVESLAPKFVDYKYKLLDYAEQHIESAKIFSIID